jgi:GT2 family glycosyltransferase
MIDVSVIIVNFNVRYFVEQAISAVYKASEGLEIEVIVVDNASSDDSTALIQSKFPEVRLIANQENVGFGKANNQGIHEAKGKYILLLNPDTVVQENTLNACIQFMTRHNDAGAIGVRMIDGKGNFLPESKRSIPTPFVALCKMSGLSALFPKSKIFAKYHLGYLSEHENHQVEVLSGAFMFFRADLLKKIGGFDEDYFMYGEDIELSYQVLKQGYKNYYIADTSIIHYKGESTKKGSLNYVKMFYEAMLIFAKKHFSSSQVSLYALAIQFAIYLRAMISLTGSFFKKIFHPVLDGLLILGLTALIAQLWAIKIKVNAEFYPAEFFQWIIPLYSLIWIVTQLIVGSYEKPYKVKRIWRGVFLGTVAIAAVYGFLPEDLRFSRAIILLGGLGSGMVLSFSRMLYHVIYNKSLRVELNQKKKVLIVGNEESRRASALLKESEVEADCIGFVSYKLDAAEGEYLGEYESLADIVSLYQIDELIFCGKDIPSEQIIATMADFGNQLNYKILPEESVSIIGSNSKNTAGDLYAIDVNLKISSARSRWIKRSFDISSSMLLLLTSPFIVLFVKNKRGFFRNTKQVLFGAFTWVGYYDQNDKQEKLKLPELQKGIFSPMNLRKNTKGLTGKKLNLLYAKNYSVETDISIVFRNIRNLGVEPS